MVNTNIKMMSKSHERASKYICKNVFDILFFNFSAGEKGTWKSLSDGGYLWTPFGIDSLSVIML